MAGEAGKAVGPPSLVEIASRLRHERALEKLDVGCAVRVAQRQARNRLAIIRVRRHPAKPVSEARWWNDFDVGTDQVEQLTHRWAHCDPIHAADSYIEVDLGAGEALRTPPLGDLLRVSHRSEHAATGAVDGHRQPDGQVCAHETMVGGYELGHTRCDGRSDPWPHTAAFETALAP